jgi:hypothetical protein
LIFQFVFNFYHVSFQMVTGISNVELAFEVLPALCVLCGVWLLLADATHVLAYSLN